MSWLEQLATQKEPLEGWEKQALKDWLVVLTDDCKNFGPTYEDLMRVRAICKKLDIPFKREDYEPD